MDTFIRNIFYFFTVIIGEGAASFYKISSAVSLLFCLSVTGVETLEFRI